MQRVAACSAVVATCLRERQFVCDVFVDLDFTVHVVVNELRDLRPALVTTECRALQMDVQDILQGCVEVSDQM